MIRKYILAILLMFVSLPAFGQDIAEALVGRTTPARTSVDFLRYAQEVQAAALAAAPITRATTYYISTTGSDAAAGTIIAPWQTIDKVNDTLRDNVVTNTAFLFARNGVWAEDVGIEVEADDDNVTIGAYGTGAAPQLHAFTTSFATGGTLWTDAASNTRYTATLATAPGWVRIKGDRNRILRKVADATECTNTQNSWYWASNTLHVHVTQTPTSTTAYDPDSSTYGGGIECTLTTMTDDDGIAILSGATGVRVDSVRCDGWGMDGTESNQKYGIRAGATGTNLQVITNCSSHYASRHNLGHYDTEGGGTGGLVVWGDVKCGGIYEDVGVPMVFYAGSGDHEDWVFNVEVDVGSLPLTATRAVVEGMPVYAHTSGGTSPGFICIMNLRVPKHPQGFGCHTFCSLADFDVNADVSPDTCKGVIINEWLEEAEGTGCAATGVTSFPPMSGTVSIGGTYNFKPYQTSVESICYHATAAKANGWWINPNIKVHLGVGWTGTWCGMFNGANSAGALQCKIQGATIEVVNRVAKNFVLWYDGLGDTDAATGYVDGSELSNSVVSMIRNDPLTVSAPVMRIGLRNTSTYLRNNAYFGLSADGTYVGVSNTANAVTLARAPIFGVAPSAASSLLGGGEVGRAYDALLRERSMSGPTIGANEYLPANSYGTTLLEIVEGIDDNSTKMDVAVSTRLAPTSAGRTLDVTATGAAGIDWANVENPTSTVAFTNSTTGLLDGAINGAKIQNQSFTVSEFDSTFFEEVADTTAALTWNSLIADLDTANSVGKKLQDVLPATGTLATGDDVAAIGTANSVTADRVAKQRTWYLGSEGNTARNIVTINAWASGTNDFAFDFSEILDQSDTTINTVSSVTVIQRDGSPTITTSALRKHQEQKIAIFTCAAISAANAGTYDVTITITTADSNTIVVEGVLEVE